MLIKPAPWAVMYVSYFDTGHAAAVFQEAKQLELEGLGGVRLGSIYQPGVRFWKRFASDGWVSPR